MTVHLAFSYNREILRFVIRNREIFYSDKVWKVWVRCMPKPENFIRTITTSRNRIPSAIIQLFNYTPEEIKEYESAKDDEALADIIVKDAKGKGCIMVTRETVKDETEEVSNAQH